MATHIEDTEDPTSAVEIQQEKDEIDFKAGETAVEAQIATMEEHKLRLIEGIRKYPKAVFWSIWFSTALIMEGFDHAFITGFFAFPKFKKKYGTLTKDGTYQIPATMQSAIGNGINAGEVVGLILNGYCSDKFGYRWVMIVSLILMTGFVFLQFFAKNLNMYLGAEILLGIPWGVFQTLTTTYASEVCPLVLRPYLTMLVSLCWSIGYLVGSGTLRGFLQMDSEWAYRIPFALQWVWPVPLAIGIYFAPESPWWLVRKNKIEKAKKVVSRLLLPSESSEDEVDQQVAEMVYTNQIETEMNKNSMYMDCFKGVDLRRTEIVLMTYAIQELCAPLLGNSVYFLEQAGMATTLAFDFSCIQYGLAIIGVFIAWYLVSRVGRRTLYLWGTAINVTSMFIIGFLGIADNKKHSPVAYGIGVILLVEYFLFFITIGPLCYTIVTEIPSNKLRTKSVVLGRALYNVLCIIVGQLTPRMIQVAAWNWGAKSGFFWGGILFFTFIWVFFRLPETKNRTFAEMDILFKNKVPARMFSKAIVDIANEEVYYDD